MLAAGAVVASGYANPARTYAGMSDSKSLKLRDGFRIKFATQATIKAYRYAVPGNTNHEKRD